MVSQTPVSKHKNLTAAEKMLLARFGGLSETQRETLLSFAEFLAARTPQAPLEATPPPEPRYAPRPEQESVIAAIKRLNGAYFMLEDRAGLLNETSLLMTQHVMQGRDTREVIDELEALFARFYEEWRTEMCS